MLEWSYGTLIKMVSLSNVNIATECVKDRPYTTSSLKGWYTVLRKSADGGRSINQEEQGVVYVCL